MSDTIEAQYTTQYRQSRWNPISGVIQVGAFGTYSNAEQVLLMFMPNHPDSDGREECDQECCKGCKSRSITLSLREADTTRLRAALAESIVWLEERRAAFRQAAKDEVNR